MRRDPLLCAPAAAALLSLLTACGGGGTVQTVLSADEQCAAGQVDEGIRLLAGEAADAADGVSDEAAGHCLAAAVIAADERGEYKQLPERVDKIRALAPAEPGPVLAAAEIEARATLAHARCTDRLCCLHDGLTQYDALAEATADGPVEHRAIVERWYAATRDELLREGNFVVELDGRMIYAPTVVGVVPARPAEAYLPLVGKPVVLNNVLLMAETKGTPPTRTGGTFGRDSLGAGLDGRAHRPVVVRRPGAEDGTVLAAVWGPDWDALLADLQPGSLHSCQGTVVEVQHDGAGAGLLVLDRCSLEQDRTDALFRQRKCTVCGTRDNVEVCHDGYGRNDGQAGQAATAPVCKELLLFDEKLEDCPAKVKMTRWCTPNTDPADDAPEGATPPPSATPGDPS